MAPGVTAPAADPVDGLLPHHRRMLLEESGIAPELVRQRGYRSLRQQDAAELRALGFTQRGLTVPGLLVPGWGPDGSNGRYQYRPDVPWHARDGREARYVSPPRVAPGLDVPPACVEQIRDPDVPLYLTEGVKKADAAASRGLCVVALTGVWNWVGENELGGVTTLPEWREVALKGRLLRLTFDSDVVAKLPVWLALQAFKRWLVEVKRGRARCLRLPSGPDGAKVGLDDYLLTHTVAELEALASQPEPERPPDPDGPPEIDVTRRDLPKLTRQAWAALVRANLPGVRLLRQSGVPVRVETDDDGRPRLRELGLDKMRYELAEAARFVVKAQEGAVPVDPPTVLVANVLATPDQPLPPVTRLTECPTFAPDGTLETGEGYRPATRTYGTATIDGLATVPEAPSASDVARARALFLGEVMGDFPFVAQADRANALACGLLPYCRDLIPGPTPLHLFESPTPGSGKGLLLEALLAPPLGRAWRSLPQCREDAEWAKRITTVLLAGAGAVVIDNATRPLDSGVLAKALTDTYWSERLLGTNTAVDLPVRCVWAATANNPVVSTEIARRSAPVRLDPKVDRPWERTDFRHTSLREWVGAHRAELVWAGLVLVRHWLALGRPAHTGRSLGSYEAWAAVLGGVLQAAGVPGFLENTARFYDAVDTETVVWRGFVARWWEAHGDTPVGVADLFALAQGDDGIDLGTGNDRSQRIRFGKLLGKQRDRVIGGYRVRYLGEEHSTARWQLQHVAPPPPGDVGPQTSPPTSPGTSQIETTGVPAPVGDVGDVGGCLDTRSHASGAREEAPAPAAKIARGGVDAETSPNIPHIPPEEAGVTWETPGDVSPTSPETSPAESAEALSEACGLCGEAVAHYTPDGHARCELHQGVVYVASAEALERELPGLLAAPALGLDTETTGLDPHGDRLRLVQLAAEGRTVLVDAGAVDVGALAPLFAPGPEGPRLVGHNLGFDLQFLAQAGLPVPDGARLFDTMLAAQVGDCGEHLHARGRFTLEALAKRVARIALDKTEQAGDWGAPTLTAEQLRYAAADAEAVLALAARLEANLGKAGLRDVAQLEFDALPAVAWLERTGAPFDAHAWEALAVAAEQELPARREAVAAHARSLGEDWLDVVVPYTARQLAPTKTGKPRKLPARTFNPDSHDQQLRLLRALGVGVEDVQEATLAAHAHAHPVVPALLALKDVAKRASAFGRAYLQHAHPSTGRIHARYAQLGSEAGRFSCRGPNLQQVPHEAAYRAAFRAPEGRKLIKADYSQIELCVVAELSGDERMLAALNEGQDLHRLTAAALYGKAPEDVTPEERAFGKNMNFGTVFGQGVRGLLAQAAAQGIALDEAGAKGFLARFDQAWPQLARWRRRQMKGTAPVVKTASGRRRKLAPDAPGTFRANTPVQGTAADGFKAALGALWATRERCPSGAPVLAIHDELVVEADGADADAAVAWVTEAMVAGMRRFVTKAPVRVEASVSATWGGHD